MGEVIDFASRKTVAKSSAAEEKAPFEPIPMTPYIVQSYVDWIVAMDLEPHFFIDVGVEGFEGPVDAADNGILVLKTTATSCRGFAITQAGVSFYTRVKNLEHKVLIPFVAIRGIGCGDQRVHIPFRVQES